MQTNASAKRMKVFGHPRDLEEPQVREIGALKTDFVPVSRVEAGKAYETPEPLDDIQHRINIAVDLEKLERSVQRKPIVEIKNLIGSLTYGEMIEAATAIWGAKGDAEVSEASLPAILHRWSQT